ncbi:Yip1 family protein [Viridibacterium curvum]|uniref:Yip1 domain-containing protein n=1 Tax=Viridibacterium curvum TaxID=1101404 RepID=A0ABP9QCE8_9RHOO
MNLVERAKNILLSPKTEWPVIEGETATVKSIYLEYLVILAAIPAIATFIGMSLVGYSVLGMSIKTPLLAGIANLIVSYVLSLVMVFVVSLIADALAPSFGGQKNPISAFKLVAFSMTASMLGGIFSIIPALSMLGLLCSLYGIYVLYVGVAPLMKVPQDKAIGYTAVLIICAIVIGVVVGAISGIVGAVGMRGSAISMSTPDTTQQAPINISIDTPQGKVQIDTQKLDDMNKKMEEIGKQAEAAAASGDQKASMEAAAKALQAMGEALAAQSAAK